MAVKGAGLGSARSHWIFWTLAVVVFVVAIDEVLSLRGARVGGGFRSSSSRYSVRTSSGVRYTASSTRVRVRYGAQRPWRSWRSYGSSGYIYGYVYFTRRHYHYSNSDREPTICRNEYDNFMDNGTNYEWFICPNISNPDNYDSCCGDEDRQHCCKSSLDGARVFGIIVGLILFCLCAILLVYCCCCRKSDGRQTMFQKRFTSKHEPPPPVHSNYRSNVNGTSGNTAELTHLVNAPVNGPIANYPQTDQPVYPPMPLGPQPAYPPQPAPGYQSGCYPPVDPGIYPPPGPHMSSDLPYGVQPGAMDPGMGYPPNPSAASAPPYLPEGAPAPPYPSGAAPAPPYPPGGASAPPYPPGGAPAPPYPPGTAPAPPYPPGGAPAPPYPPGGAPAPPYPPYPPSDGAAPPYPPYPTDGPTFPHLRDGSSTNYPSSPPPSYSSMK